MRDAEYFGVELVSFIIETVLLELLLKVIVERTSFEVLSSNDGGTTQNIDDRQQGEDSQS